MPVVAEQQPTAAPELMHVRPALQERGSAAHKCQSRIRRSSLVYNVLYEPSTNPHQLSGGGYCTFCLLRSSCGRPLEPGASVGRGDIPAEAMRPTGVGIGPLQGIAPGIASATETNDAYCRILAKAILEVVKPMGLWMLSPRSMEEMLWTGAGGGGRRALHLDSSP